MFAFISLLVIFVSIDTQIEGANFLSKAKKGTKGAAKALTGAVTGGSKKKQKNDKRSGSDTDSKQANRGKTKRPDNKGKDDDSSDDDDKKAVEKFPTNFKYTPGKEQKITAYENGVKIENYYYERLHSFTYVGFYKNKMREGVGYVLGNETPIFCIGGFREGLKHGFVVDIHYGHGVYYFYGYVYILGINVRRMDIPSDMFEILKQLPYCMHPEVLLANCLKKFDRRSKHQDIPHHLTDKRRYNDNDFDELVKKFDRAPSEIQQQYLRSI